MKNIQLKSKKGMSIGDMYPAVLTLVLVGIVLGVGLYVLSTFHDSISPDLSGAQVGINATSGTTTLTDAALTEFYLITVDSVINDSSTAFTNYSFTTAGVITWGTDIMTASNLSLMNTTYTYRYDESDSAQESVTTTIAGIATFADWIAIIVVVVAAAIVLGIVLTSFGGRRNRI